VARAIKELPGRFPPEITAALEAGKKGWSESTFKDSAGGADVFDGAPGPAAKREPAPPANVWAMFMDSVARHAEVREWLIGIVIRSTETTDMRRQALTPLLTLTQADATRDAFFALMKWYRLEAARSPADAEFRETVVRHYLVAHAIRNTSLSDVVSLGIVIEIYGAGWESFLKVYSTIGPMLDLQPDRRVQERAKQLLAVAKTRFQSEAEQAAFRAEYTAGARSAR
jgi:hypothetical protein